MKLITERQKQYQPSKARIKLYLFLEKKNLVDPIKVLLQKVRILRKKLGIPSNYISPEEMRELKREEHFHKEFYDFFYRIKKYKKTSMLKNNVLISGYISTFTKGGNLFFKKLNEQLPNINWVMLSQSGKKLTEKEKKKIAYDVLSVPRVPFKGGYDTYLEISLTEEMKSTINSYDYLQDAIYNLKCYHDDMGDGYPEALVFYTFKYVKELVKNFNLQVVIVHNKLYPMHDIMVNVCKELGVNTMFFEFGALPGTFALESRGQMGASSVAINYEEFRGLPINDEELHQAEMVCSFLKESRLNRNKQPATNLKKNLLCRLKQNRPIVLYAGQNDYDSGICPYTEYSREFHSPIFPDSTSAAVYLAKLAEENDWNLIYKPHPLPVKHGRCLAKELPQNIIWISDIDINEIIDIADVVVTILSQVGDIALIRGKATVMLGYTQLRGKGCCYESFSKNTIEDVIKSAIEYGYQQEQQKAFIRHVAQVLKYYLFDDLSKRELRFGRDIQECAAYIRENMDIIPIKRVEKWLFYCRNLYELYTVARILKQTVIDCERHLFISEELREWVLKLEIIRMFKEIFVDDVDLNKQEYSNIFVPTVNQYTCQLYFNLNLNSSMTPKIQIYDSGMVEDFYQDIPKNFKLGKLNKFYKKNKIIFEQIETFCYYEPELLVWKNVGTYYKIIKNTEVLPFEYNNKRIKEKYIFIESDLFEKKIISNEIDMLDILAEKVGKEEIIVKIYNEKSRLRYEMRGYKTISISLNEWCCLAENNDLAGKCIISFYPLDLYAMDSDIKEVYLYKLFVGNFPFLYSNSFKNFMHNYVIRQLKNKKKLLIPQTLKEYQEFLEYIKE